MEQETCGIKNHGYYESVIRVEIGFISTGRKNTFKNMNQHAGLCGGNHFMEISAQGNNHIC